MAGNEFWIWCTDSNGYMETVIENGSKKCPQFKVDIALQMLFEDVGMKAKALIWTKGIC